MPDPKSETKVNKSAWIRSQPPSVPALELVNKAKQLGFRLSVAQVYTARSAAKHKAVATPSSSRTSRVGADLQQQFKSLAIRIGTEQARRLLRWLEQGSFALNA